LGSVGRLWRVDGSGIQVDWISQAGQGGSGRQEIRPKKNNINQYLPQAVYRNKHQKIKTYVQV
jgi:hypothetical protein